LLKVTTTSGLDSRVVLSDGVSLSAPGERSARSSAAAAWQGSPEDGGGNHHVKLRDGGWSVIDVAARTLKTLASSKLKPD
jgi:hypothetical protein